MAEFGGPEIGAIILSTLFLLVLVVGLAIEKCTVGHGTRAEDLVMESPAPAADKGDQEEKDAKAVGGPTEMENML